MKNHTKYIVLKSVVSFPDSKPWVFDTEKNTINQLIFDSPEDAYKHFEKNMSCGFDCILYRLTEVSEIFYNNKTHVAKTNLGVKMLGNVNEERYLEMVKSL